MVSSYGQMKTFSLCAYFHGVHTLNIKQTNVPVRFSVQKRLSKGWVYFHSKHTNLASYASLTILDNTDKSEGSNSESFVPHNSTRSMPQVSFSVSSFIPDRQDLEPAKAASQVGSTKGSLSVQVPLHWEGREPHMNIRTSRLSAWKRRNEKIGTAGKEIPVLFCFAPPTFSYLITPPPLQMEQNTRGVWNPFCTSKIVLFYCPLQPSHMQIPFPHDGPTLVCCSIVGENGRCEIGWGVWQNIMFHHTSPSQGSFAWTHTASDCNKRTQLLRLGPRA